MGIGAVIGSVEGVIALLARGELGDNDPGAGVCVSVREIIDRKGMRPVCKISSNSFPLRGRSSGRKDKQAFTAKPHAPGMFRGGHARAPESNSR